MHHFRTPLGAIALALATFASAAPSFALQHPSSTGADPELGLADHTLESPADPAATQLTLGHAISFEITGAAPGEVAWLLVSAGGPATPADLHGVPLVVDPLAFVVLGVHLVGATGEVSLRLTIPSSLPLGQSVHVQALLFDRKAATVRATNGLVLTTAGEPLTILASGSSYSPGYGAVTVSTEADWQTLWCHQFNPWYVWSGCEGITPPVVDFETNAVLCTFAGDQPSTAYSFSVDSVVFDGTSLLVHGTVWEPGEGCGGGDLITYPYVFVLIDAAVAAPAQLTIAQEQGGPCG